MRRVFILSMHLFAILVPMALGWGFDDLSAFAANPVRAGLIILIVFGAAAVLWLRIDLDPLRVGAPATAIETQTLLALTACAIGLIAFLAYADRRHILTTANAALPWVRWAGLGLCAAGGTVRILALRQLGPQFSAYVTLQPQHQLVQSGIYSMIRHPLYLSLLLAGPGVALVFASQLVWPISLVAVIFTMNRIQLEERLLSKHFGGQFENYRGRSRKLLPLFW
jgi:protein-S-isoprenylcysteine O-methyltransferase Ste14